ncbi:MAG: NAD(P)H-dependent oxidoreductase subunit E [Lachnospiraceae bacterium]|nr:NAD(P)H-dependent oxidoreductase subunit E [Lachnospiraceae bacterium]
MLDRTYYDQADEIVKRYGKNERFLIPIMQDIQEVYRYIPGELLTYVAEQIGVTRARAFSVATFYENFSFQPKGKFVIKVCDGTACHVRKSIPVKEEIMKILGLTEENNTTADMLFTIETVSCLGACGLAPTMMVNEDVHPNMTPQKADELIEKLKGGEEA